MQAIFKEYTSMMKKSSTLTNMKTFKSEVVNEKKEDGSPTKTAKKALPRSHSVIPHVKAQ